MEWLQQKRPTSEYSIAQWLELSPEKWETPLQIPSPHKAEGGIETGSPVPGVSILTTEELQVIKGGLLLVAIL